jgi:hypothetical protein
MKLALACLDNVPGNFWEPYAALFYRYIIWSSSLSK